MASGNGTQDNYPNVPHQKLDVATGSDEEKGNVPSKNKFKINEQSTVTVLVASAFCCCFLLLSCVACACGYLFLLLWGAYILDDASSATSSACEDAYHIWTFSLLNEFVGLSVTICGCGEACRVYQSMTSDSESGGGPTHGCFFFAKYIGASLVTLTFFIWGMVEWFQVTDSCITEYDKKYEALMLLFRTGVIADAIILLVTLTVFVIQRAQKDEKHENVL
jgi:hypothetical protein